MYIPKLFDESRIAVLHDLISSHPLGTLITVSASGPVANHIPFLLDKKAGAHGTLRCHVARSNPVWKTASENDEALVIFQGPEAYVTPSWYPSKREHGKVVPTWNYAVVHARGVPRFIEDSSWLLAHVHELTNAHEASRPLPWTVADAPADFVENLARAIVGVEIEITSISGKWKMSQNRPEADQLGVVAGLEAEENQSVQTIAEIIRQNMD